MQLQKNTKTRLSKPAKFALTQISPNSKKVLQRIVT